MDFQKAFDSVPHQRLLKKILSYRITGKIYSWIEAFLSHRQQRVVVNGAESDWAEVTSGIPQGSVLGPVLFTIYINDMPRETVCPIKLFADDAKIYHRVENTQDCQKIQEDLEKLQDWAKRWQLRFHPHKCTILHVGANHPDYRYYMTDGSTKVELSKSACEKDLGVYVDASLKFDYHISTIVKKANQMTGLLWTESLNGNTRSKPKMGVYGISFSYNVHRWRMEVFRREFPFAVCVSCFNGE